MPQTLHQRISKLWAAAFNLESAARAVLPHLPDAERQELEQELAHFHAIVKTIRKN